MKPKQTEEDFLVHLAKTKIVEMQSDPEGAKLFPLGNTMRTNYYVMGFVDGFNEGRYFAQNKDKKPNKKLITFDK